MQKNFLLYLLLLLLFTGLNNAICQPKKSLLTKNVGTIKSSIPAFSNSYAYPVTGDSATAYISEKGISNWDNANVHFKTFFYPQVQGIINISVQLKSPGGNCMLEFMLDSSGKKYIIKVKKSAEFTEISVGAFTITNVCYHCIQVKGISKTGQYFPVVKAIIVSGAAAKNVKYNISEYKGAASTHLWYDYPKDSSISWFYNEVTVPPGVDATNAYYMTNGFNVGYMGIQLNSFTERRIIFSIWSNYSTDDPKKIPADYAVTLIKKGKDVFTGDFGNEGSGGHSHLTYMWKQGTTYKLLVGAKAEGDHTIYTGYYYAPENDSWRLIAQWNKTKTNGELLKGLYSFVENFGPNGNDFFKADYDNQWICTSSGKWIELTRCSLTTTASPEKHQRYDYGAGVEDNKFYMFTGGFNQMNNLVPHSFIERKANGVPPGINFSSLPKG